VGVGLRRDSQAWRWKGGQGVALSLDFEIWFSFELVNWNFTTVGSPWKNAFGCPWKNHSGAHAHKDDEYQPPLCRHNLSSLTKIAARSKQNLSVWFKLQMA